MKISKLFHWIYATLMFLPIMYIFSRCLFVIFNKNAVVTSGAIDDVFIDSLNNLNTISVFAWAQTSFLNVPFQYISDLFGIASTNPINTLLSYWLSISVIYLVFDLIMYVPLLVHRWLDRGMIE